MTEDLSEQFQTKKNVLDLLLIVGNTAVQAQGHY